MFNKSEIMKAAWASYRRWHSRKEAIHGQISFDRDQFAFLLALAWNEAKQAQMTATERRRAAIQSEIEALKFKSFRYDIGNMERELKGQLAALDAA